MSSPPKCSSRSTLIKAGPVAVGLSDRALGPDRRARSCRAQQSVADHPPWATLLPPEVGVVLQPPVRPPKYPGSRHDTYNLPHSNASQYPSKRPMLVEFLASSIPQSIPQATPK